MPSNSPFLFPALDHENSTLAVLRPLQISGMVRPIEEGDGGINIAVVSESADGILCVILAYLDMQEGDKHVIYWDNKIVFNREVEPGEVNKPLFFYLPAALFTPGWFDCYYELTPVGQTTPDDPSVPARLFVKLNRPGGRDKAPHLPDGHSELHIAQLPPELIEQGIVDAEWAKNGFDVIIPPYPEIALRDTVLVRWGSFTLAPLRLTQEQVDGLKQIVIHVDQDAVLAGGDSDKLEVKYDIHDNVWNWAVRHSQRTNIAVDVGAWRLAAPIIMESINGTITIKDLNKQDVTVQIHIQGTDFALGDTVKMTWIGTPFTGKPLIRTEFKTVANIPSIMEFKVPYADVRAIAMGRADASYVLTKVDDSPPLSSKRRFADVVGDVLMLPEPTIRELLGDTLESDLDYATMDIEYPGIASGDLVVYHWLGKTFSGQTYLHEDDHIVSDNEAKEGGFTVYVDKEHISVLDKGSLDLSYTVSNDEVALYGVSESEHLLAKVEKVTATLPVPRVEEADPPDVLDPSRVFDIVHVLIEYPGTKKDDILTYYWQSISPIGSTSDWVPITSLTAGKPLRFRVAAKFVTINIGQYVKVRYSLKHAATGLYSHSATLDLLIGSLVGELPPAEVEQAPQAILDPIDGLNGVDVKVSYENMDAALDIIRLKWVGTPGAGTSQDLELPGHTSGSVRFHLPATVVGPNINKEVDVSYVVRRYGYDTDSESLGLRVLAFQKPETELPHPRVLQATVNVLDMMTFSGDAKTLVDLWPYIALKQRLWLRLEGKTTSGVDYIIKLLDGVEITAAQVAIGLDETLLRTELMKLGHSTPAIVVCKIAFDGGEKEGEAITFPQLQLTIRTRYDYVTPKITGVTDSRGDVDEGGKTRDKEVTVKGTATRGETVELFDALLTPLGTARVGDDNVWTRIISGLTEKTYSITAKALYDADPVTSDPRTFEVKFAETPEILKVSDSRGIVKPGTTTYDNSVQIEGIATPNERIRLLDSKSPVIELPVNADGNWRHTLSGLTVKPYVLNAEALYDIEPPLSPRYAFDVAQAVTPTISRVADIRGDVDADGTTYYKTVTLYGKASPNEKITLRNGASPINTVDVKASGDWEYVFNNLLLQRYSVTAKGEYGSEPVSDPPRVFTPAAHISPTITSVNDSVGTVAPSGTTYDTTVTVLGEATPKEQIQMYNKSVAVGPPVTVDTNRQWRATFTGLAITSHSIAARALYVVDPVESQLRNFTVAAHTPATLTSVHDGLREVGQETKSTSVTLRGNVTPNHEVQIHDNGAPGHTVRAVGNAWSTTLGVSLGSHSITAKAVSTGQFSNARAFRVISPIPPLTINTATMNLSAWHFRSGDTPSSPAAGTFGDRSASGGVPPYRYSSSNSNIAEVNASSGRVISSGNGSATITAMDNVGQTASYNVATSNVDREFGTGHFSTYVHCANTAASMGGRIPSLAEWRALINIYSGRPNYQGWCWASDSGGIGKRMVIYPATGQTDTRLDLPFGGGTALGYGIRRA
ncbi:hypothetical protein [Pseudomonas sp. LB3P14]